MTDTKVDARRWNAFVCQDCRAIFRVPADYVGKGIVCPRCDRMLRMPLPGESVAPLQDANDPMEQPAVVVVEDHAAPEEEEISTQGVDSNQLVDREITVSHEVVESTVEKLQPAGEWKKRKHTHRTDEAEDAWQQLADP